MKKISRIKFKQVISVLACMLLTMSFVCVNLVKVYAAEQAVSLSLHSKNPLENVSFRVTNMFPGDSTTQYYKLSVSYTGTITVNFQATVQNGDEKLADMLGVKVRLLNTGELLYEGMLANMPILGQELSTDSKSLTEELTYEITVGLSTSVGNEYQNKSLIADFSWWAEGDDTPEGGDNAAEPSEPESGDGPTEPSEPESGDGPTEPSEPENGDDEEGITGTGGGSLTNPQTGDDSRIYMWLAIMCVSVSVMILVLTGYRRSRLVTPVTSVSDTGLTGNSVAERQITEGSKSRRSLFFGIFLAVLLILGLGITSVALIWQKVAVEENLFVTGRVSICLNDDQPIFQESMLFEPGMVVKKDFTLRNDSTCDVHYRLYFTNVDGDFAEALQVEVLEGDTAIFEGTLAGMNGQKSEGANGVLKEGEERVMTIVFRVPEDCGNVMQGRTVLFDLNADAVQTVNNPGGMFE